MSQSVLRPPTTTTIVHEGPTILGKRSNTGIGRDGDKRVKKDTRKDIYWNQADEAFITTQADAHPSESKKEKLLYVGDILWKNNFNVHPSGLETLISHDQLIEECIYETKRAEELVDTKFGRLSELDTTTIDINLKSRIEDFINKTSENYRFMDLKELNIEIKNQINISHKNQFLNFEKTNDLDEIFLLDIIDFNNSSNDDQRGKLQKDIVEKEYRIFCWE